MSTIITTILCFCMYGLVGFILVAIIDSVISEACYTEKSVIAWILLWPLFVVWKIIMYMCLWIWIAIKMLFCEVKDDINKYFRQKGE